MLEVNDTPTPGTMSMVVRLQVSIVTTGTSVPLDSTDQTDFGKHQECAIYRIKRQVRELASQLTMNLVCGGMLMGRGQKVVDGYSLGGYP